MREEEGAHGYGRTEPSWQRSVASPPARPSHIRVRMTGVFKTYSAKWSRVPGNVRGGVWLLLHGLAFVLLAALVKHMGTRLHVTEILFFRQVFMFLFVLPLIVRDFPRALMTARPDLQAIRVVGVFLTILLAFTAYVHLPLADVTTIGFAKSFFVTIFAVLILGEAVGRRRWIAVLAGFVGVVIVVRPEGAGAFNIYGLMAICAAAAGGFVAVIIRKLSQTDQPVTILTYHSLGVALLLIPPTVYFWTTPTWTEFGLLFAIGALSGLAQMGAILAYRAGEAAAIAPLDYVRLLYAVFLGLLLFGDWPSPYLYVGAAIIIAASFYTIRREARDGRSVEGPSF